MTNSLWLHPVISIFQLQNLYFSITGENKQQHRTKYVDMIISQLAQSNIRFLFSTGQAESALFVSTLAKKESKKGHSLPKCLNLPMLSEKYLPFYLSLPGIYISLHQKLLNFL